MNGLKISPIPHSTLADLEREEQHKFSPTETEPKENHQFSQGEESLLTNQANSKKKAHGDEGSLPQNWKRPTANALKINIDGSYSSDSPVGAISCVCRNKDGELVDGFVRWVEIGFR
ncbi:hypothetical protein ACJRO7_017432 [Eucalyptus globulus]|uniref:RNase H type-1 domain-containing protein n=1 Tax=Eucalyptus globulus TaxID=34317 RepID=A0ABD3KWF2_EUCGL